MSVLIKSILWLLGSINSERHIYDHVKHAKRRLSNLWVIHCTKNEVFQCDQIRRKRRIWSYLLKKSSMENFTFCAVFLKFPVNMWTKLYQVCVKIHVTVLGLADVWWDCYLYLIQSTLFKKICHQSTIPLKTHLSFICIMRC